jgi:hypothetical protein
MYEGHRNRTGYPISFGPEGDPDTPFWATIVSFSKYTGTPSAIREPLVPGILTRRRWRILGQPRKQNFDIGVRRALLLERMESEVSQKDFDESSKILNSRNGHLNIMMFLKAVHQCYANWVLPPVGPNMKWT